jgi:hypothetical protein
MDKFLRKLRRELTRNPKQTAVLAGGLLVAAYFWAPLVMQWCSKSGSAPAAGAETVVVADGALAVVADPAEVEATASLPDWRTLAQAAGELPFEALAELVLPEHDPFRARVAPVVEETHPEGGVTKQGLTALPAEAAIVVAADWKLDGILSGPRLRAAIINGRVVREGESMVLGSQNAERGDDNESSAPVTITAELVSVQADYVVLRCGGEMSRIELKRPALAAGDQIAGTPKSRSLAPRVTHPIVMNENE